MGAPERAPADEAALVEALLGGDERAFEWLVGQHHATLVRLAVRYVRDPAIAEEVAQETWLQVLKGLPRFQLRSSLKTWMTQILMNRARTRARRDRRSMPFSDAWLATLADGEPAVDQDRFTRSDSATNADRWASAPRPFLPEERIVARSEER